MEIYSEDHLSAYEAIRQRNIIANFKFMQSCGLPVKPLVFVKTEETQPYNPSVDNTPVDHILIESEFEEKLEKDPKKSDTVEESNPELKNFCSPCIVAVVPISHNELTSKESLQTQKRTHSLKTKHKCDVCGTQFRKQFNLKRHERTHTGEKPFVCNICGKAFKQTANHMKHVRIHTGERPYECNICRQWFQRLDVLKMHQRTHTGELPYVCDSCGKRFSRRSNLTIHERIHRDERPFVCRICGKAFKQSNNLKSHQQIHARVSLI